MTENKKTTINILIVFYTRYGNSARMADEISKGAKEILEANVAIKRIADDVPMDVISKNSSWAEIVKDLDEKYPPVSIDDLVNELPEYDAIIFGSPTRFGNMSAQMKTLWDRTSRLWLSGSLIGKVGGVFTSASSVHGGQETTAISMMFPMLHHGMIIVGVPYSIPELTETGSPYSPSRVVGPKADRPFDDKDIKVARGFGKRIAEITYKLVRKDDKEKKVDIKVS
ncbi:MAG TPA: NAD(P)H:quinone oxidoreductase [Nitrososphaeraceae archaeon]|jgi:NAD(P)H dehydrogenase (quinone)